MSLLSFIRRDTRRARRIQAEHVAQLEAGELQPFLDALPVREPHPEAVIFARVLTPSGSVWAGRKATELQGQHITATGSTGGGKSVSVYTTTMQLLRAGFAVFSIDLKGEISALLTETAQAIVPGVEVRSLRPFGGARPPLRVTQPEPGVPVPAQALAIAQDIVEILGEPLSLPMQRVLVQAISLCIEIDARTKQAPLPLIRTWLDSPLAFARAAQGSADPALRAFVTKLASSDRRASATLQAVGARLDALFLLAETRAAFEAPTCLDFAACFDSGLTLLDLSAPPGCHAASRILGALLLGRAVRAALSRPAGSKPAVLLIDELQELVAGRHQRDAFARALALARFRGLSVISTFQGAAQIDAALIEILRTNSSIEFCFRMNDSDARAYLHALPLPPGQTPSEARRTLLRTLTTLPRRSCLVWPRFAGVGAAIVQTPRIDFDALRTATAHRESGLPDRTAVPLVEVPLPAAPITISDTMPDLPDVVPPSAGPTDTTDTILRLG